jgi:HSP20 family protein
MMTRFGDVDRTFAVMDELRKRMDRMFDEYDARWAFPTPRGSFFEPFEGAGQSRVVATWPRISVHDTGSALVLLAEVPGMKESDLKLEVNQEVLSFSGERKAEVPEGYALHRRERAPVKFARTLALPCKIDAEKATAILKDGLLTLTLPKAPEAQPRQINVKAAS